MNSRNRAVILTALCVMTGVGVSNAAAPRIVLCEPASTALRHAAQRLSKYTGMPVDQAQDGVSCVRIELNANENRNVGRQGYTIRSAGEGIAIRGNTDEGIANGVYTFLRTLMIEHRVDPFSRSWNLEEKPRFAIRGMQVAPYRFGSSYGFAALSPDRWSFEEWKEYLDFMRLCNMTTLLMGSARMYHPDYPNSWREKWRYEVWKQVMDYCHQVGMKFEWFISPNLVTEQAFWDNPDKRAFQEPGAWYGNGLNWDLAKEIILKNQRHTLEYFRGLDALHIIYSDGGGFDFNIADPARYFGDATRAYIDLMRRVNNDAHFVFWNWTLDFWSQALIPDALLQKYPKYRSLQDDVVPLIPKDVSWLDASILTLITVHWKSIQDRSNPPLREGILIGKESGFKPVIDFFWYMNPELGINMFPHPFIRRGIQEAQYARDELGADGVLGYRLDPPLRFIDDYVFFRLASDPGLTQDQLISEAAGMLCEKAESRSRAEEAIRTLEQFWTSRKVEDIEKAEELFRDLLQQDHSKNLRYVSNGVTFLTYVVRLAQSGLADEKKNALKAELFQVVRSMYIFQGLTADIVWLPEAIRFFYARVEMLAEDYKLPLITSPYLEVVDRRIYPKATSRPVQLNWPKQ